MKLDVKSASPMEAYQVLTRVVTPRPIAWVTTMDLAGRVNLAPYSFFNMFGSNPPVVVFSPTLRRDGTKKDTLRNIEATGEFVLNAAVESLAKQINLSSKEIGPEESEIELTGLSTRPSTHVRPPRLAESPVAIECKLLQVIEVGHGPGAANLVIGEVLAIEVDDAILDAEGRVDTAKLRTIGRLGGDEYCRLTDIFTMERPV